MHFRSALPVGCCDTTLTTKGLNPSSPPLVSALTPDYHRFFPKKLEFVMRHVLSAVVQNVPGVLAHISGMLASRGYNIDSLAVGETEDPHLSRMTFVVVGDDNVLEQVRKQLEKIVTVVRVVDISSQDFVERDLMLIKVSGSAGPPGGNLANWPRFSAAGSSTWPRKSWSSRSPGRNAKSRRSST